MNGYLSIPDGLQALMAGDAEKAYATFTEERETGRRFADQDPVTFAGFGQGQALIAMGMIAEGVAVLDEVMVGVSGGEASAIVTGLVYCGVIAACMEIFDPRRAKEWTTALDHWCSSQPDLVSFRGQCLVHRAQIMQIHGAWVDALEELRHAFERFTEAGDPAVGDVLYEQAEVHRLRGDFDAAEQAYRQATLFGRDAQPGLALLRLAQGQLDRASAGIRRALDETGERFRRPRLLSAAVEIALQSKDVDGARSAVAELAGLAAERDVALLSAMAAQASGTVLLAEGDARAALSAARRAAWSLWQELDAPYEAARARVVVGMACRSLGDEDAARMELAASRWVCRVWTASRRGGPGGCPLAGYGNQVAASGHPPGPPGHPTDHPGCRRSRARAKIFAVPGSARRPRGSCEDAVRPVRRRGRILKSGRSSRLRDHDPWRGCGGLGRWGEVGDEVVAVGEWSALMPLVRDLVVTAVIT